MDKTTDTWTIGQLARRVGMRPSALRYYEQEGLLFPIAHTGAGYRMYDADAERTLFFIQRAQRLGFSLADIRLLLQTQYDDALSSENIVQIAEKRFLTLERQITGQLALRHEMAQFLREFPGPGGAGSDSLFDQMVNRVCAHTSGRPPLDSLLDWLIARTHCTLSAPEVKEWLERLRGLHTHIWHEDEAYHILVVSSDPQVEQALHALARLENHCHAHPAPQVLGHREGWLLVVSGENAFIFARLFLALEQESEAI